MYYCPSYSYSYPHLQAPLAVDLLQLLLAKRPKEKEEEKKASTPVRSSCYLKVESALVAQELSWPSCDAKRVLPVRVVTTSKIARAEKKKKAI